MDYKLHGGLRLSKEQWDIFHEYVSIFFDRWGMKNPAIFAEQVGNRGGDLFEMEFETRGPAAYSDSVVLPFRNAFYQTAMLNQRWYHLREMGLMEPILDYGCGVGLLLVHLKHMGKENLWGYELPGIQQEIMAEAFRRNGIGVWDDSMDMRFNTIICINVLEHVADPVALLHKLYSMSNRVIADICIDTDDHQQSPHIAPVEALRECKKVLNARRSLYAYEPHEHARMIQEAHRAR